MAHTVFTQPLLTQHWVECANAASVALFEAEQSHTLRIPDIEGKPLLLVTITGETPLALHPGDTELLWCNQRDGLSVGVTVDENDDPVGEPRVRASAKLGDYLDPGNVDDFAEPIRDVALYPGWFPRAYNSNGFSRSPDGHPSFDTVTHWFEDQSGEWGLRFRFRDDGEPKAPAQFVWEVWDGNPNAGQSELLYSWQIWRDFDQVEDRKRLWQARTPKPQRGAEREPLFIALKREDQLNKVLGKARIGTKLQPWEYTFALKNKKQKQQQKQDKKTKRARRGR